MIEKAYQHLQASLLGDDVEFDKNLFLKLMPINELKSIGISRVDRGRNLRDIADYLESRLYSDFSVTVPITPDDGRELKGLLYGSGYTEFAISPNSLTIQQFKMQKNSWREYWKEERKIRIFIGREVNPQQLTYSVFVPTNVMGLFQYFSTNDFDQAVQHHFVINPMKIRHYLEIHESLKNKAAFTVIHPDNLEFLK